MRTIASKPEPLQLPRAAGLLEMGLAVNRSCAGWEADRLPASAPPPSTLTSYRMTVALALEAI